MDRTEVLANQVDMELYEQRDDLNQPASLAKCCIHVHSYCYANPLLIGQSSLLKMAECLSVYSQTVL